MKYIPEKGTSLARVGEKPEYRAEKKIIKTSYENWSLDIFFEQPE